MGASLGPSSKQGSYRPMAEINVTPFVDVMLVLLVVFMVAAPLLSSGVPVDLPDSEASPLTNEDDKPIEVSIRPDGVLYVGETKVKRERLIKILASVTDNDPNRRIYIRADQGLDYGVVMEVLGGINSAGFKKVALLSEASSK